MIDSILLCTHSHVAGLGVAGAGPRVAALRIDSIDDRTGDLQAHYLMYKRVSLPRDIRQLPQQKAQVRHTCDEIIAFVNEADFDDGPVQLLVHCEDGATYSAAVARFVAALYGRPIRVLASQSHASAGCQDLTAILHDAYLESCLTA